VIARRALVVCAALCAALAAYLALDPLPPALRDGAGELAIEDATGGLLREAAGVDGRRADWVPLDAVPEAARAALIALEDRGLYVHPGVDPRGLLRALIGALRHGRVVGGGSTLAMQLARASYDLPRSMPGKLVQLGRGLALQQRLGPDGVLEAYFNLAPFGRDVRGIGEASLAYFGKPLRDLTVAEAVSLACLPRAPTRYDPYLHGAQLVRRRDRTLALLAARGAISEAQRAASTREPLTLAPFARPFRAPHAVALARAEATRRAAGAPFTRIRTTIEPALQRAAAWACARAVADLEGAAPTLETGCAAVVQRVDTGAVLALVGSPDFAAQAAGQVNGAIARRQPGSALKPFVYALAFERGRGPGSRILDAPTRFDAAFGDYVPENYDRRFHGEITLREALACSYNVPAAKLTAEIGPSALLMRLRRLGLESLDQPAEHYGVGLALGVGEVRLLDLVAAYATLARGGTYLAPTLLAEVTHHGAPRALTSTPPRRVFSRAVSYLVSHVLADAAARAPAFGADGVLTLPFEASVKTGTSSHYRDNWALGYTDEVAIGVWVGRPDGAPLAGVAGVSGAGPALRHLLLTAVGARTPRLGPPPTGVARTSSDRGSDLRLAHGP
jgi:penicillin-binding protein 1C